MEVGPFNQAKIDNALARARALRRLGDRPEVHQAIDAIHAAIGEMKAAQQKQQEFFETAPMAYLRTDRQGLVVDANAAAAALLHTERSHIVGRGLIELIASPDRRRFRDNIGRLIENPGREEWETRLVLECSLVTVSVALLCQMHCGESGYLWAIRDLRELRRAQSEAADGTTRALEDASRHSAELAVENQHLRKRLGKYLPSRGGHIGTN